MNDILISVLIPTRSRPDKLRRCIDSILSTAAKPERIELVVRMDDDDDQSDTWSDGVDGRNSEAHLIIGPRLGYARHAEMYWQMATRARGRWLWIMNDDGGIIPGIKNQQGKSSEGWDDVLEKSPVGHLIVSPDGNFTKDVFNGMPVFTTWYAGFIQPDCKDKIGDLAWGHYHACHFPIVPNKWWEEYGIKKFGQPLDTWMLNLLAGAGYNGDRKGLGWQIATIPGLSTFHAQEQDALFTEQRKLNPYE